MKTTTFAGWKREGRVVMAGQRSRYRNEYGDPMFSRDQTTPIGGVERITVYRDTQGRFVKQTVTTERYE